MSASSKLTYFLRTAVGSLVRSPFVHLIAISSLCLSLIGFGVARVTRGQLRALSDALSGDVELTVYFSPDAEPEKVDALEQALIQRTQGSVTRVSPAEALSRLVDQLGPEGEGLLSMASNPLPWSLEVKLPKETVRAANVAEVADRTRALPFVLGVDYGEAALDRLALLERMLEVASLVVFALVFFTAIIVVSATLQLAIFSRREEIEIQKMVGGTDRFVRFPFLLEGMIQGLVSGALALGVLFVLVWLVQTWGGGTIIERLGGIRVKWGRLAAEIVGIGCALGLFGSFIAVRRFLRV
jgi:cell division transport system permease protein